ncbi:MAG: ArsA-related P-loop ATPase [Acidimicrobiales bacterium]
MTASRVLIVAGKGGVGKTTLGATLGLAAARLGLSVALIELEGHSTLGRALGAGPLDYRPITIDLEPGWTGRLEARRITPDEALAEYLGDSGLRRVATRLIKTGAIDVVATAAPGIRDLLALGKIRQLEERGGTDLIVVDAPGSGHAITFLRSAAGIADASPSGPLRDQADLVLALLADERRCQTMLITLPEETPINEVVETAFSLEDQVGVKLAPVVINGCWPSIDGLEASVTAKRPTWRSTSPEAWDAAVFRLQQIEQQTTECRRLAAELPLPQLRLPHQFTTRIERPHLLDLVDHLMDQLDTIGSAA